MPDDAPEKLFRNLPKQVLFPLNPKDRLPHGLIWFADKDGNLPDADPIWRDTFDASEEELAFSGDRKNTRKILYEHELFGIPYRGMAENGEEYDFSVGIALGKRADSESLLYMLLMEQKEFLAVGRAMPYALPYLIEDAALFHRALSEFPVHPSRIASGRDSFRMEDHEPGEEKSLLGPWNFMALRSNSLENLKAKAAAALAIIHAPDRLWAAYLRTNGSLLNAAVFSLVEAGGKRRNEPLPIFDVSTDIEFDTGERGSLLRLMFFWQR